MAVKLSNLVRVEDIVHAFKNEVPMYTADGVYQVVGVAEGVTASGNHRVDFKRVDTPEGVFRSTEHMQRVEYNTAGEIPHFDPTAHHMTIMADKDTVGYYCTYTVPGLAVVGTPDKPEDVLKRDTYLRKAMYPRISEHEMD